MFARWTQENSLKYMGEHYAIDRLVEHGTEPLPETTVAINPAWRQLDSQLRREQALRDRDQAAFGALTLSAKAVLSETTSASSALYPRRSRTSATSLPSTVPNSACPLSEARCSSASTSWIDGWEDIGGGLVN